MNININITPWWLTGFTQADGSFLVTWERRPEGKLPYYPRSVFSLTQTNRDRSMMEAIHAYLGVGQLFESKGCVTLTVRNLSDLINVIIPHFDTYPLRGGKLLAYLRFKVVCLLKRDSLHLQLLVFLQIVTLTCSKAELHDKIMMATKDKFGTLPNFVPIDLNAWVLPLIEAVDMNIDYVTGLIDGDGSINFTFPSGQRQVSPNVTVIASLDDYSVLEDLIAFFKCGKINKLPTQAVVWKVVTLSEILSNVWPLIMTGTFNTVKRTYIDKSYAALLILQERGVRDDRDLLAVVDLVYDMNLNGKRRKLTKTAYLDLFIH